jgi:predicted component of type VI protein secretion system
LRTPKPSPNSQEAECLESGGPTAVTTSLVLEIGRGRTEHRRRPVQSPRFLIGSSSRCDLCLGGADIPALHSMICLTGNEAWVEAMANAPELSVNGRPEKSVRLKDGDSLRIGPFELIVHLATSVPVIAEVLRTQAPPTANDDSQIPELAELSPLELVERIEAATQLVNDYEERSRLGIESLLQAVEQRRERMVTSPTAAPHETVLPMSAVSSDADRMPLGDLEGLVAQISGVVGELEKRSGAPRRRETGYRDPVSSLFETQDRLSRQLEILLRRVASLNSDRSAPERGRAIA